MGPQDSRGDEIPPLSSPLLLRHCLYVSPHRAVAQLSPSSREGSNVLPSAALSVNLHQTSQVFKTSEIDPLETDSNFSDFTNKLYVRCISFETV